ncbi:hypothetical protein DU43_01665 [Methanosarcina mazei]|uniref:Membrane protein 6-pyruvoyl-tetrahydropterin synthase-related domain-containing protein n=1 Tax=Methanosarcina mazei TaxID=2209 RepID=A0A0F8K4V9_METMZ|nr:hypothetical protein [Methanosarcina mazei]KKG76015.1 hypothetical protein DU43_01665 [Methanosarcina mazei]
MFESKISRSKKVILFTLLIILNIVLRIPSIPHEKGADSFFIHSLANSITTFGHANWWLHWLSAFGYYPYSYASAIPFSLSGISQATGIELEYTILIFCIIIGLFSIFSAYILAGVIYDDFLFKYLMALFYSTSPSIMFFSTWEISTRGPLNIFLPVYLYLIMGHIQNTKRLLLLSITGIFLFSIHHIAIVLVPITSLYIVIKLLSKTKIKIKPTQLNYAYLAGVVVAFAFPFFNPTMTGITGSRYSYVFQSMTIITRYIGPMMAFAFSGLIYLALRNDKKIDLWYILVLVIFFIPFMYNQTYGIHMFQLFIVIILTVGFRNLLNSRNMKSPKIIGLAIIIILVSSVMFSAFYNHQRTGKYQAFWYMDDKTKLTGEWISDNINKDKKVLFSSENYYRVRALALQKNGTGILTGGTEALTYGFIDKDLLLLKNLEKVPFTDSYYYSEAHYRTTEKVDEYESIHWYLAYKGIKKIKDVYDLDYLVQSISYPEPIGYNENKREKIYSDGLLEIYDLRSV